MGTIGGAAGAGLGAIIAGMFGSDDSKSPTNTGGDQIVEQGPTNTGGKQLVDQYGNLTHTGNPESSHTSSSNTGNTSGVPDTDNNTTVTRIPDGPGKDDLAYLALTGKEAEEAVKNLGFDPRIPASKVPFNSHGQPAFFNGKVYITPDIDSYNVTNGWKMFDRRGTRLGTYDSNLNKVKG